MLCLKMKFPKTPNIVIKITGFKNIFLATITASLHFFPYPLDGFEIIPSLINMSSSDPLSLLLNSIKTKPMGFKIAKLIGAIRYK